MQAHSIILMAIFQVYEGQRMVLQRPEKKSLKSGGVVIGQQCETTEVNIITMTTKVLRSKFKNKRRKSTNNKVNSTERTKAIESLTCEV